MYAEPPGTTSYVGSSAEYTRRKLMEFPVDPAKVRVHIANYNRIEDQMVKGGSLDDISLWIGEAAIGAESPPERSPPGSARVRGTSPIASTLASGSYTSDWLVDGKDFNFDPDKQYVYRFSSAPAATSQIAPAAARWGVASSREARRCRSELPPLKVSTAAYLDVRGVEYQYAKKASRRCSWCLSPSAYNLSGATGTRGGELDTGVNQWADTYNGVIAGNIAVSGAWTTEFDRPDQR